MPEPSPSCSLLLKPLSGLARGFAFLFPIRIDNELPDLTVKLWRFSPESFQIQLAPHGGGDLREVYCRVRLFVPVTSDEFVHIDHSQWVSTTSDANRTIIPHDSIPSTLLNSTEPLPGPAAVADIGWIAIISRRDTVVNRLGSFYGRVVRYAPQPVSPRSRVYLSFLWHYCWPSAIALVLWSFFCFAVLVGVGLVIWNPEVRHMVGSQLHHILEAWSDLSQPFVSPVVTSSNP